MELLKNPLRVWAQHREFRAVLAELNGRSDHELEELGLARGDIARIAYEEAERRIVTPAPATPRPLPRPGTTLPWRRAGTASAAEAPRHPCPAHALVNLPVTPRPISGDTATA